uniref:Uncharacterized protein n=1 Tax=Siphoviridae sp. ctkKt3 TaxID=2825642 RepID=A0A8S5UYP7_9CAUD|nr:MAG TPA: hypothetical protein [Siphoviridae sp. ctkKt3]
MIPTVAGVFCYRFFMMKIPRFTPLCLLYQAQNQARDQVA